MLSSTSCLEVLYDEADGKALFPRYSQDVSGNLYIEILQRSDGYFGFGAANASFRIAAQKRLARGNGVPRVRPHSSEKSGWQRAYLHPFGNQTLRVPPHASLSVIQMTGAHTAGRYALEFRDFSPAAVGCMWASGMEMAARRWMQR